MQEDFHYYATYCAAYLAGYSHEDSLNICYSAQFVDHCSRMLLGRIKAPKAAATTQLQPELMDAPTDLVGLQDITRIWASFHFLPGDLRADVKHGGKAYRDKYRLICNPNGDLVEDTVRLAKDKSLQAVGIAMHVLADTWAHRYFAGTPSLVINNTNYHFFEILDSGDKQIVFKHNPKQSDDLENSVYISSIFQSNERSIMNLGHGRAGHLPDYSFIRYKYMPAWGNYSEIVKDNPSDYFSAFCQMIYAMRYLRGDIGSFEKNKYDFETAEPMKAQINAIITKRQLSASDDWKAFGEKLSGSEIPPFDIEKYTGEYEAAEADAKNDTFLGKFTIAAMEQKSMVTNKIFRSRNLLAGFSVDYREKGFAGIRDYRALVKEMMK